MLSAALGTPLIPDGEPRRTIGFGGWALILGALAFMAVFAFLAARFDYPAILDGPADLVFFAQADPAQREVVSAVFDGLNTYLGNYVGEFLGELCFSTFFLLSGWALLRSRSVPAGVALGGLLTGVSGLVGALRNLTPAVAAIAAVNNYLLPAWMIGFGVILLRLRTSWRAR